MLNLFYRCSTLLLLLSITACSLPSQPPPRNLSNTNPSIRVTDASGTEIALVDSPQKIVCLHLSCIDTLAELDFPPIGVHNGLLSLANSQVYFSNPKHEFVPLAGHAEVSLEQLLQLKPDLIMGVLGLEYQRQRFQPIAPLYVLQVESYQDALENLKAVGALIGRTERAEIAAQAFLDKLNTYKAKAPKNRTVLLTNGTTGRFFIATDRSLVGSALAELVQYPWELSDRIPSAINWAQFSQEEILKIDPDVIFILVANPQPNRLEELRKHSFWQGLKAVRNGEVYELSDDLAGGLSSGTRSLSALLDAMMPKVYPDVFGESAPD
ncbi:ABC transporter substrate-binding protein [Desertifilum sp. FACHB-1129]|uniref:Fe/B12 periplasmic-binding domain-containing protein n=1 Tax=Desertifilum tharense IPPAS B-1220 TaxID=1781255 RepID=A0A1E5QQX1_9CYAN|nr:MULTISPECIES: ABC transporter substrate-binding protein [Desertifilum]MBD2314382.1 ABC transporter substrate-binding protein [Desertifilum sp. FACHB-1129]MBD2323315.1 ABC transporter substrate-binding protein [Desertifilum sp. FACHB-866]MDA0213464.1 ABC transporter substrate-binding protein [Cyanobacteria bacterium FC1]OEJ76987.1 hypothetical protein BH720_02015 [Desertifilum tharense IPPAS B-1220]